MVREARRFKARRETRVFHLGTAKKWMDPETAMSL
jgi:hypothetical protein